jgi:hypothetical protein
MAFGTLGHAALCALFKGTNVDDQINSEIKNRFNNDLIRDQIERISIEAKWAASSFFEQLRKQKNFNVLLVEKQMSTIVDDILFTGTPDLVIQDDFGNWVVDHKFRKTFYPSSSEDVNLQMFLYHRLIEESEGIKIDGSMQFQIQPRVPVAPEKLKNGKLSKKDIWCNWDTYRQAVLDNKEDEKDYLDMKEKLDKKKWFDINECKTRRAPEEVDTVWRTVILPAARRIQRNKLSGDTAIRAMNHFNCKRCDYLDYCVEDLKGGDLDFLMATKYKLKHETSFMELVVELEDE